jgi:hypothetical protein
MMEDLAMTDDQDLPGMWERSDFEGGRDEEAEQRNREAGEKFARQLGERFSRELLEMKALDLPEVLQERTRIVQKPDGASSVWRSVLPTEMQERIRELIGWIDEAEAHINPNVQRPSPGAVNVDELFYDIEVCLRGQKTKPEDFMETLRHHIEANPTHGVNCICMDGFVRLLRSMFPIPSSDGVPAHEFTEWLNGPENKLRRRMAHIFGMYYRSL